MEKFIHTLFLSLAWLGLLGLSLWAAGFIIFTGSIAAMMEPKKLSPTDAIIVLTGGTNRVSRGLDLLSEGYAKDLLISGAHKDVKLNELLSQWKYQNKLPECCITLGHRANNTIGNAIEAQDWVREKKISSIRLVTANYHMARALLEFHEALPQTQIISHPILPENFSPHTRKFWRLCFLEYHKFLLTLYRIYLYPLSASPEARTP